MKTFSEICIFLNENDWIITAVFPMILILILGISGAIGRYTTIRKIEQNWSIPKPPPPTEPRRFYKKTPKQKQEN